MRFAQSLTVSIMESCQSEGAKLELIQFVSLTIQTLIIKGLADKGTGAIVWVLVKNRRARLVVSGGILVYLLTFRL